MSREAIVTAMSRDKKTSTMAPPTAAKKRKTATATASKKPGWIAWNECEANIVVLDDLEMRIVSLDTGKLVTPSSYSVAALLPTIKMLPTIKINTSADG
jgi:hypothetical protein